MRFDRARRLHNGDEVCLHARLSTCRAAKDYGTVHRVHREGKTVILEIVTVRGALIERTHREVS